MNIRTTILTIIVLWIISGIIFYQKYHQTRRANKASKNIIKSSETIFLTITILAAIFYFIIVIIT